MSTGPGPTRKPDGTADASVDDIADLLVEDDHSSEHAAVEDVSEDNLDVMLETPGPALANPFMPPPPSPMDDEPADENETSDDSGGSNLAYEDLLAKLVLPAKAPEPELPQMPAVMSSLPLPEPVTTPVVLPGATAIPTLQAAPPAEERTLVTENPLVAEEQEAAVREGRAGMRDGGLPLPQAALLPVPVQAELRSLNSAPVAISGSGVANSRLLYLMLGGLLVLGVMILAVLIVKVLMPGPAPTTPPAVVAPTPVLPPPPPAPPAVVEPLPPSAAPAAAVPSEPAAAEPAAEAVPTAEPEVAPRPHKVVHPKPRVAAPKPVTAPKPAPVKAVAAPKVAPAPKPPKAAKKGKTSGYADPFDN